MVYYHHFWYLYHNTVYLGLMEFDSLKSSEVNQFRGKMKVLADQMQADRRRKCWLERLLYQFAPRLAASTLSSNVLPATVTRRLINEKFSIDLKFENIEVPIKMFIPLSKILKYLYCFFRLHINLMWILPQHLNN